MLPKELVFDGRQSLLVQVELEPGFVGSVSLGLPHFSRRLHIFIQLAHRWWPLLHLNDGLSNLEVGKFDPFVHEILVLRGVCTKVITAW